MIPAERLPATGAPESDRVLEFLSKMKKPPSPNWYENRRHEEHAIREGIRAFGPDFEDFLREHRDAVRRIIFTDDIMVAGLVSALEKAIDTGYVMAHTCYDKTPRPIAAILREVRDLDSAGLVAREILWKFDPWTGTLSACGRPLVYYCSTTS